MFQVFYTKTTKFTYKQSVLKTKKVLKLVINMF